MNTNAQANLKQLSALLRQGEGPALKIQQNQISPHTSPFIAMCKKHGVPSPLFEERQGFLIITFRALLVAGRQNRTRFRDGFVKSLIEAGLLELTIPNKPRSSKQKYRMTEKGRQTLNKRMGGA